MASHSEKSKGKPLHVAELEAAYGAPSQAGLGSAVFYTEMDPAKDLVHVATVGLGRFIDHIRRWWWVYKCTRTTGFSRQVHKRPIVMPFTTLLDLGMQDRD